MNGDQTSPGVDDRPPDDGPVSSRARVMFQRGDNGPIDHADGVLRPIINAEPFLYLDDAVVNDRVAFPLLLIAVRQTISVSMTADPT